MSARKTLEEIRKEFPAAHYAPDPECKRCEGTGIRTLPPEQAAKVKILDVSRLPCICIFMQHDLCNLIADCLSKTAKRCLSDLDKGAP